MGQYYIIHTDASTIGVGACLLQVNSDTCNEHPIPYCSRPLTKHEKNYAVIELEALAIVFAFKQFYLYVANASITDDVTDHAPLKSLTHRSDLVGRLAKYQIIIQAYDIKIEYRAGPHFGVKKTFKALSPKYYFPHLHQSVIQIIRTCPVCQKIETPSGHIICEELGSLPIPQRPFERLHTDIVGPLPQCIYGNRFISITVCAFIKFVICTAILNQTTETVVKALINDVIAKHGIPNEIVSDRGSNYTSEVFSQISKILGISNMLTTSYYHKAKG
ncbi:hypothetical protein OESDEN_05783 [Oesophagostomum dentatum]|uniref:RNA-directed DNA polymerase n=1 Tax=Oesophagostomum dentatum TaxID=61180 RepID=A0A0B1TDU9_OESDE|nr:hypothetical protein OESDEN_05783 [Oesophagostomum dentatum]